MGMALEAYPEGFGYIFISDDIDMVSGQAFCEKSWHMEALQGIFVLTNGVEVTGSCPQHSSQSPIQNHQSPEVTSDMLSANEIEHVLENSHSTCKIQLSMLGTMKMCHDEPSSKFI